RGHFLDTSWTLLSDPPDGPDVMLTISRFTNTYVLTVNCGYEHVAGDGLMGAQHRLFDDERLATSSADEGRFFMFALIIRGGHDVNRYLVDVLQDGGSGLLDAKASRACLVPA